MRRQLAFCGFLFMLMRPAFATEAEDFEALIRAKSWHAAGLMMFEKANKTSQNLSFASEMSKAGYSEEALAHAYKKAVGERAYDFLMVAQHAVALPNYKRIELLVLAEQDALGATKNRLVLASISAAFLFFGAEIESKQSYATYMDRPNSTARDYRRLAEAFEDLDPAVRVDAWAIDPLLERLETVEPGFDTAFTFQKLSLLYFRGGNTEKALSTLERGLQVAVGIENQGTRRTAVNLLAETALVLGNVKLAEKYGDIRYLIRPLAVYAARIGDTQKALDILPTLGANLYVNHRNDAITTIIREAVDRHDLVTARRFLRELPSYLYPLSALFWLQIADIEKAAGNSRQAEAITLAALAPYSEATLEKTSPHDFSLLYRLATMLMARGEYDKAQMLSNRFDPFIEAIEPKLARSYIKPRSLAADLCGKLHDFVCASREILEAHKALQQKILAGSVTAGLSSSNSSLASDYAALGSALGSISISSSVDSNRSAQFSD